MVPCLHSYEGRAPRKEEHNVQTNPKLTWNYKGLVRSHGVAVSHSIKRRLCSKHTKLLSFTDFSFSLLSNGFPPHAPLIDRFFPFLFFPKWRVVTIEKQECRSQETLFPFWFFKLKPVIWMCCREISHTCVLFWKVKTIASSSGLPRLDFLKDHSSAQPFPVPDFYPLLMKNIKRAWKFNIICTQRKEMMQVISQKPAL